MNSIYSAMRKLFREVIDIEWNFKKLPRPNKERHLPELLSQKDVLRIIRACPLLKHQSILVTLYASGLRSLSQISHEIKPTSRLKPKNSDIGGCRMLTKKLSIKILIKMALFCQTLTTQPVGFC